MDSELKLKKRTEELTVRDITLETFVLTVAMVTESLILRKCYTRK